MFYNLDKDHVTIEMTNNAEPRPLYKRCKSSVNGMIRQQKSEKGTLWPIHHMTYTFSINGEESVKHSKFKESDFSLPKDSRIANYDEPALIEFWNAKNARQTLFKQIYSSFTETILWRTAPILFVYLLAFYVFNMALRTRICAPSLDCNLEETPFSEWIAKRMFSNDSKESQPNFTDPGLCKYCGNTFEMWREKEHGFMRILTFLLGFYVSYILRNWWRQVSRLPRMDAACIAIASLISVKSPEKEDQILIKEGVTVKQFKITIARLFLLSWTMCLSRFSPQLKRNFKSAKAYNVKGLLTRSEYNELKFSSGSDGWIEKWSLPLLWVNKMTTEIKMSGFEHPKCISIKDQKEMAIMIYKFQSDLQKISNHHFYKTPNLIMQAISAALYFFLFLGIVAGQVGTNNEQMSVERLFFDLPVVQCVKYLLLFGWLKTAKDLQNPFGHDR